MTSFSPLLDQAFSEAKDFIEPVIAPKSAKLDGRSAAEVLAVRSSPDAADIGKDHLTLVLVKACQLLWEVQRASTTEKSAIPADIAVLDTNQNTILYALLDLLIIEGLYPSLSPGVGFPKERQKKSLLCNRDTKIFPDLGLLDVVVLGTLNPICFSENDGLGIRIRDRILVDLIAANADLSFSPLRDGADRTTATVKLHEVTNSVSVSKLYPALTALIRPPSPAWFRASLSEILSLLPLRPHGVRHFIEFIAKQFYIPSTGETRQEYEQQLTISPEGIAQITKLLSSVPKTLDSDSYFSQLSPQLLGLLDGEDGPELSKVAAFVITDGILSKRLIGSPGTPGWRLFVEPLQNTIEPKLIKAVVTEESLTIAQKRLWALVSSHPSPALTGRLVRTLMPSLWGISIFKKPTTSPSANTIAFEILRTFLRRCANLPILRWFEANLRWNGPPEWQFASSSSGGIEIQKRIPNSEESDVLQNILDLERLIPRFLDLISGGTVEPATIGQLFLQLTKETLLPGVQKSLTVEEEDFDALVRAQLIRGLLERFGTKLATDLEQTYELINQLLEEAIKPNETVKNRSKGLTRDDISQIVLHDESAATPGSKWSQSDETDDLIATAASLLNAMLDARNALSEKTQSSLKSTLQNLQKLLSNPPSSLSQSTLSTISTSISLLITRLSTTSGDVEDIFQPPDDGILARIAADLASPLPPTRAAALTTLVNAILDIHHPHSQPMDVPTLTLLLLSIIRTDSDSFVNRAAISALTALAISRDSGGFVLRTTVNAFIDRLEQTDLDGRLRVGEALSAVIEGVTDAPAILNRNAINKLLSQVAASVLVVASRRGKRVRETKERERTARLARLEQKQAEQAWGGEIPDLGELEDTSGSEYDEVAESEARAVVEGWAQTGHEEDVRIRASALSLLSTIIEHGGITVLDKETHQGAAEVPCHILNHELEPHKAVLRRAAVMIFMAEIQAENAAFEDSGAQARRAGWDGKTWFTVEEVLHQIRENDEDEIVRGHARAVLENLDAFRFNRMTDQASARDGNIDSELGLTSLRGLDVSLPDLSKKPKIEEIN